MSAARNRSSRSGCAPAGSGSPTAPVRLASATAVGDVLATVDRPGPPDLLVIDSDPDHVGRRARPGARHGHPAARRRPGADPLRQAARQRGAADRPRHQGRPDRRPARARAHGRRRALLRGRARPRRSASCARSRTASAPRTRSACSRWPRRAWCRSPTPRPCSSPIARRASRARPCSPASRAAGPLLVEIQALVAPSALATRHAVPWSAGTATGWPCCWRCSRPAAVL